MNHIWLFLAKQVCVFLSTWKFTHYEKSTEAPYLFLNQESWMASSWSTTEKVYSGQSLKKQTTYLVGKILAAPLPHLCRKYTQIQ